MTITRDNAGQVKPRGVLQGHTDAVREMAFSPDGQRLVSRSGKEIIVWNLASGQAEKVIPEKSPTMALSPDGSLLAISPEALVILDVNTGQRVRTLPVEANERVRATAGSAGCVGLAFSADGRTLVSADKRSQLRVWDTATWTERYSFSNIPFPPVSGLTASTDSGVVAISCGGVVNQREDIAYRVRLWDIEQKRERAALPDLRGSVAFSPDGALLAAGGQVWDIQKLSQIREFRACSLAFAADNRLIASADPESKMSSGKTVRLWDSVTGEELAALSGHGEQVWKVLFSPDNRLLASCSGDILWRAGAKKREDDRVVRLWGVEETTA